MQAPNLVIATGGLSIPKIGATDFGYRLAQQFNLPLVERTPGLVPMTFDGEGWQPYAGLAGLALPVEISTGSKKERMSFHEDLLFTHRGLSGPAVLQISSYWKPGTPLQINLLPGVDLTELLAQAKLHSRKLVANELAAHLPARLADAWVGRMPELQRPSTRPATRRWQAGRAAQPLGNHAHRYRGLQKPKSRWAAWTQGAVPADHGV